MNIQYINNKFYNKIYFKNGCFEEDMKHRIRSGWIKCKGVSSILCDREIPIR